MPQGPTPFGNGLYSPLMFLRPIPFASLPASPQAGMTAFVSNSNTSALGATIAGGGSNKVFAIYTGSNWIVAAGTPTSGTFTNLALTGYLDYSFAGALASVGTNRGTALALAAQVNQVTSGANTTGVVLPAASTVGVGGFVRVINDNGANSFHVYAAGSDTIDGTAGSTGVVLTNAFYCDYYVSAAGAFTSVRVAFARSA